MKVLYLRREHADKFGLRNFPSFHRSGSVRGMKMIYYGKDALLVRSGSYIYKVTPEVYEQVQRMSY